MTSPENLKISALVPTYKRVDCLKRCLDAVAAQTYAPLEIIVTVRDTDAESRAFMAAHVSAIPVRTVIVTEPGVVAAMNAGLDAARGDVLSITDDDARPWPDWLERLAVHFADAPDIAGVGGRDYVYVDDQPDTRSSATVGKIQWFGRLIGNHRWGVGSARSVQVLKGVNCAYRVAILREIGFDRRLRGAGAQLHWELSLDLSLAARGYRLIFEPKACVDHFEAVRFDEDKRVSVNFNKEAQANATHNETLVLFEHLSPMRRVAYLAWATLLGTRAVPGIGQTARNLLSRERFAPERFAASWEGRIAGIRSYRSYCKNKTSGTGGGSSAGNYRSEAAT